MQQLRVKAKDLKWLTNVAFSSRKRESILVVTESVTFHNTFWDGGSRNQYKAVRLSDGKVASLDIGDAPWSSVAEGKTIQLEPGVCIVESSVFCGEDMRLRVHMHPDNVTKILPSHRITDEI